VPHLRSNIPTVKFPTRDHSNPGEMGGALDEWRELQKHPPIPIKNKPNLADYGVFALTVIEYVDQKTKILNAGAHSMTVATVETKIRNPKHLTKQSK